MKLIRKSRTALRMGPGPKCAHPSTFAIFFIREHTANSPNSERAFSMARMRATPITYPRGIFLTLTDAPAPPAAGLGQLSSVRWQRWKSTVWETRLYLGCTPSPTQHEVLQRFFNNLQDPKDHAKMEVETLGYSQPGVDGSGTARRMDSRM